MGTAGIRKRVGDTMATLFVATASELLNRTARDIPVIKASRVEAESMVLWVEALPEKSSPPSFRQSSVLTSGSDVRGRFTR